MVSDEQVEHVARQDLAELCRFRCALEIGNDQQARAWEEHIRVGILIRARLVLESGARIGKLLGLLALVLQEACVTDKAGHDGATQACRVIAQMIRQEAGEEIRDAILAARQQDGGIGP